MDDPEALDVLKNLVTHAVNLCTDADLLDLLYKLLTSDSRKYDPKTSS